MRRFSISLLFVVGMFMLAGCPSTGNGGNFAFAGQYHNSYAVGGGTIVFGVSNSSISIVVNDAAGIFAGNGTRSGNTFSIVCTGGPGSITVDGAFTGEGTGRTVSGSASGATSFSYSAAIAMTPNVSFFQDEYFCSVSVVNGALILFINSSGIITGNLGIEGNPTGQVTGTVNSVGTINASATSGGENYSFFGIVRDVGGGLKLVEGTWSRSPTAGSGEWEGNNIED